MTRWRCSSLGHCSIALALLACGDGSEQPGVNPSPTPCVAGETKLDDGSCLPAGTQPDGCPAGEHAVGEICQPAGIPPELCAPGFEPDGTDSCDPIVPTDPCPPGQLALLGETQCHEVAPCGSGPWGDIPVAGSTQFVDASYALGTSDGSAAHPWTTIQEGIDAASPGTIVAVAAGSYVEDLLVGGKAVRLWGRCPALVEVVGGATLAALYLGGGSEGTEVRDLAIVGAGIGVVVQTTSAVLLDRLWIHDTADTGLSVGGVVDEPGLTLSRSLLEANAMSALTTYGSQLVVDSSVLRNVQPNPADLGFGHGIYASNSLQSGERGQLTVQSTIIDGAHDSGVFLWGTDATFEGILVRDTKPTVATGIGGTGLYAAGDLPTGNRASVILRSSVLEHNHLIGVLVAAADADLEGVAIRDTLPDADPLSVGVGLASLGASEPDTGASVTLRACVVERNPGFGVRLLGADAVVEATVIRDTLPHPTTQSFGRGIDAMANSNSGDHSDLVLRFSVVERCHSTGVVLWGSQGTIEGSVVRNVSPDLGLAKHGFGVSASALEMERSALVLRWSVVELAHEAGVAAFGSDLTVEGTIVRDILPSLEETLFGDAVAATSRQAGPAIVSLSGSRLSSAARAGVGVFGSEATLGTTALECNAIHLDAETYDLSEPTLVDLGGNVCGCDGTTVVCKVLSSALEPPTPPAAG